MSEERVLPCPFCGGAAIDNGKDATYCANDGCSALIAHAIPWARAHQPRAKRTDRDAWNTRTPPPEVRRVCEEMRERITIGLPGEDRQLRAWLRLLEGRTGEGAEA